MTIFPTETENSLAGNTAAMPGKTETLSELERRQRENRDANRKVLQELGLLEPVSGRSGGTAGRYRQYRSGGIDGRSRRKLSDLVGRELFRLARAG